MPPSDNDFIEPSDLDHEWEQHVYTDVGAFAMIPLWFLRKKPSDRAVHLMAVMLAEFGSATKNMWPSVKTLMEMTGASESSVRRSFKELQDLGVLRVESRTRPNGSSTSNAYHFRLTDPRFWEGGVPPLTPHGGSTTDTPRSISSKKKISSPPLKITDEFKETMRGVYDPLFVDFERKWRSITNSKYLNGRVDQQQYVKDKLDEHVENGWGTREKVVANTPVVFFDAEAEDWGQVTH